MDKVIKIVKNKKNNKNNIHINFIIKFCISIPIEYLKNKIQHVFLSYLINKIKTSY
jgi:hypothetical protein